jgi:hypothetical protein
VEKAKAGQTADYPSGQYNAGSVPGSLCADAAFAGIAECGTDALRFALVAYTSQVHDS